MDHSKHDTSDETASSRLGPRGRGDLYGALVYDDGYGVEPETGPNQYGFGFSYLLVWYPVPIKNRIGIV